MKLATSWLKAELHFSTNRESTSYDSHYYVETSEFCTGYVTKC